MTRRLNRQKLRASTEQEDEGQQAIQDATGQEFRDHVARLYLQNNTSAKEVITLVEKAHRAGIHAVEGMAKAKGSGVPFTNTSRNLKRELLKTCESPDI